MQHKPIFYVIGAGLLLLGIGLLILYIFRRATGRTEGFDAPKVTPTSTNVEVDSALNEDVTNGDAMDKSKVMSACDMPAGMSVKHYRSNGDIVDDSPADNNLYMYLQDPSIYQQEVSSSSQLALQAIRSPYYEMNLSTAITGDVLPKPDSLMSRDGSAYIIQNVDITPPINPYIADMGQNGAGGVSLE